MPALPLVAWLPAHVRLVYLHRPAQTLPEQPPRLVVLLFERGADQAAHPPRRLVGDSGFPLDLLGAESGAGVAHLEDDVEPRNEGGAGAVEDGPCRGVDVGAAYAARVALPLLDQVVLRRLLALRTGYPTAVLVGGPAAGDEVFEARPLGGEPLDELSEGERAHGLSGCCATR